MRRRFSDLASSVFAALSVVFFVLGGAISSAYVEAAEPLSSGLCSELYSSCPENSDFTCAWHPYCNDNPFDCFCHDVVDPHDGLTKCTCVEAPF